MTDVFKLLEQAEAAKKLANMLGISATPEFIRAAMQGTLDLSPKTSAPASNNMTSIANRLFPDKRVHPLYGSKLYTVTEMAKIIGVSNRKVIPAMAELGLVLVTKYSEHGNQHIVEPNPDKPGVIIRIHQNDLGYIPGTNHFSEEILDTLWDYFLYG